MYLIHGLSTLLEKQQKLCFESHEGQEKGVQAFMFSVSFICVK